MKQTLLFFTTTALIIASTPKMLMTKHCASCHMITTPKHTQIPTLKYPPMDSVVFHINLAINGEKKKKDFIVDYALNPHISKSVCKSHKVKKYGVMPSVKGITSKEELEKIATYMLNNFPSKEFQSLIKEMQTNDKIRGLKHSAFLINKEGLPHFTKLLIHNWDKKALALTTEQKEKLLLIRKETLNSIKKIKKQLRPLEMEIVEAMIEKEDPSTLKKQLHKIAQLKTEATQIQLKCISKTTQILSEEQIEFLLPFWN